MRAMRTTLAAACLAGLAPAWAPAADATVEQILRFQPLIKGVEYDIPADAAAIAACKVETVAGPKGPIGYALRDGQGKMLTSGDSLSKVSARSCKGCSTYRSP